MTSFVPTLRLLPRLSRRGCDLEELLAAALRLSVVDPRVTVDEDLRHPALLVEEDERTRRTDLAELARDVTRAGSDGSTTSLDAALRGWLARRPVPDAEAARRGIAVLNWIDENESRLGWQVVVHRDDVVVGWCPHPFTPAGDVLAIRSAARSRAADVVVRCTVEGSVLLLDADEPLLATAALSAPNQVLAAAGSLGFRASDPRVVVTPGRPVAWAEPSVAARLAGETVEPCVILPATALHDLPWV